MRMKEISMTPYPFQIGRVWTVASMPSFSFFSFHFISFHFSFFSFHCAVLLHFSVLCLVCRIERVSKCERARPSLIPKRPCTFHRINLASSVTVLWAIIRVKPALSARTYATVQIGFVRFHRSKSSKKNENRNCFTQFQFGIRSDTYCFHQPKYCECTLASFCCSWMWNTVLLSFCVHTEREKEKENKNALSFSNKYSITYEMACIAHSHTMEPDWAK